MTNNKASFLNITNIIRERPLDINIEVVNGCPLKCVFCRNQFSDRDYSVMKMDLFQKIVTEYIEIGGGALGLSSMLSDVFMDSLLMERLRFLKSFKDSLYIYTTNPLVSLSRYDDLTLKEILDTFDLIQVSVDGYNRDDYLIMTGVDGFDVFWKMIYRCKEMIERHDYNTHISLYFRTSSIEKLEETDTYKELSKVFYVKEKRDSYFDWFGAIKPECLPEPARIIYRDNSKCTMDCAAAMSTLAVRVDGLVSGCGCVDWEGEYIVGDCNNNSILEIWNSDEAIRFRNCFSEKNIPSICKKCGLYCPISSAYSKTSLQKYKPIDGLYYEI